MYKFFGQVKTLAVQIWKRKPSYKTKPDQPVVVPLSTSGNEQSFEEELEELLVDHRLEECKHDLLEIAEK